MEFNEQLLDVGANNGEAQRNISVVREPRHARPMDMAERWLKLDLGHRVDFTEAAVKRFLPLIVESNVASFIAATKGARREMHAGTYAGVA